MFYGGGRAKIIICPGKIGFEENGVVVFATASSVWCIRHDLDAMTKQQMFNSLPGQKNDVNRNPMSYPRLALLMLTLVTLVVYLPVTKYDFINRDDGDYFINNQMVQQGLTLEGVQWAFTTFHAANWHPLTWLSLMVDYQIFGFNVGAFHLVNILFHAANTGLLFLLLWRLTGLIAPAALAAALFAWHPLHVESVAWLSERKDVLSTFFGLLALLSYVRFAKANCRREFWMALFFFVLSLLAKPMLVTLPGLLLLLDFWPMSRWSLTEFPWPLVREKIPFFALSAASCAVTFFAQQSGHAIASLVAVSPVYRVENAITSAAWYLLKLFWPTGLAIFYPLATIQTAALLLAISALLLFSVFVWRARHNSRCWLFGWSWFLVSLVPVIGLVQIGSAAMADHYSYIPSMGIFVAVAFGLYEWPRFRPFFPVAILPLIVCVFATERQLGYWRNSETLFRHDVTATTNNYYAHEYLGIALEQEGRFVDALAEYREALRLNPAEYHLHYFIANMLEELGKPADALGEIRQCLVQTPDELILHCAAGLALAAQGNLTDALAEIAVAERCDAHNAAPHLDLARIYFACGQDKLASEELQLAARTEPYDPKTLATVAHYLAANKDDSARDSQSALLLALKANELTRNRQAEAWDVLGMAFAATGDFSNAVVCAENALVFTPTTKLKDANRIQQRLELYKNHQPWRESFRATNALPFD